MKVSGGRSEEEIRKFLKRKKNYIVITTYSSSYKVLNCCVEFDTKIEDEAHHLTSHNMALANKSNTYVQMLNISATKQIGLTATLKQLESVGEDGNIISNDNVAHFGEIIVRKNFLWAIKNEIVCDYLIQTITAIEEQLEEQLSRFNITNENDKRLFLSAYTSLKSINDGHSHHLLIYSNGIKKSKKIIYFVKLLLENKYFELSEIYYSDYNSNMKPGDKDNIICQFEGTEKGIISCVYCLSEGWDFPKLDAVVFAENMSSVIRTIQCLLRASRKWKNDPNKISKIILPILIRDDWLENNDNPDLKKVREVIHQMGSEDETVEHKIKVCCIEIKPQPSRRKEDEHLLQDFGEYDEELTQKLRLKTTSRTALGMTYEKTRKILTEKNIKSKQSYMELCKRDNRLTPDPERVFKSQFTDWFEFLSLDKKDYYDVNACKDKVANYLASITIENIFDLANVCSGLCKLDPRFPPDTLWVDCYKIKDLGDIISILPKKKKVSKIL